jgi:hypothetical protein
MIIDLSNPLPGESLNLGYCSSDLGPQGIKCERWVTAITLINATANVEVRGLTQSQGSRPKIR